MYGFVHVLHWCGFVFWPCVVWMSGLDFGVGLAGKSCGVNLLVGFPLASLVVVGQGCVHAWFCVCFALVWALCFANVFVRCLVWILVWVLLLRVAV